MGGGKPEIPDPMQTSRDHLALNRTNQYTPYGSQEWRDGALHTTLNPMDQQRLDMQRQLQSGLLQAAMGGGNKGGGGGAPMPPMPPAGGAA